MGSYSDDLNRLIGSINPTMDWFDKVKFTVNKCVTIAIGKVSALYSVDYWKWSLKKRIDRKTSRAILNETFDLEDDNQSGTLRVEQIADLLEEIFMPIINEDKETQEKF